MKVLEAQWPVRNRDGRASRCRVNWPQGKQDRAPRQHRWLNGILSPIVLAALLAGCVTKSKAKADAQAAFLAGQQQAMMRMAQPREAVVTFIGPVRNPTVPWSQDLTLAKAIVQSGYNGSSDPKQIMIVRNGQAIPVDPQKLLNGEDVPLVAGDLVQIGQ
jgi:hypothetical protein